MSEERALRYAGKLSEMIQCETISSVSDSDKSKFYEFHRILERLFPNVHRVCEKHDFNGSLLFHWKGKEVREPILFMSHMDVVEAGGKWEHAPFGGEIANGKLWGRGTVDTKGSLFCFLEAAEELIESGYVPACDIYLASSCTEEIGGGGAPATAGWLKEQGVRLRFLLDEGGMIMEEPMKGVKGKFAMIGCLEKGYGDVKFIARSKGGHASAPGKGTPLPRLGAFMHEVERHNPFTAQMNPTVSEMLRRMAPHMSVGLRFIIERQDRYGCLLEKVLRKFSPMAGAMISTTLAFTMARGSGGLNVLPQEAYVTGNMRFIHHQGAKESIDLIRKLAKKHGIQVKVLKAEEPGPVTDHRGEEFKLVEDTIRELFPEVIPSPYAMTGGTDARFYGGVCENLIRFAPLEISREQHISIHGLNENIDVRVLPGGVDFYRRIMEQA